MKASTAWPKLDFAEIQDTLETLHQYIQIVGKIRLRTMPWQNHSWHCALYITPTGFSTHGIPYQGQNFQIDFDFKKHQLIIQSSHAPSESFELKSRSVSDFYQLIFNRLSKMNIEVSIHDRPNELEPAIPFEQNKINEHYDRKSAHSIWLAMLKVNGVFYEFRSGFIGKASPVHLFWGAFDLAVTRFSGNSAPLHQGGVPSMPLEVMQEAYSKEVSSAGFWLGSKDSPTPVFYSYAYPSETTFGEQNILPEETFYSKDMGEYFLKYEDVQQAEDPEQKLRTFLRTTYEAAAVTSKWDRSRLES